MGSFTRSLRRSVAMLVMLSLLAATPAAGVTVDRDMGTQRQIGSRDPAELCRGEGYKSLAKQDGTRFKSVRECVNYIRQNGEVKVIATASPLSARTPVASSPTPAPRRITTKLPPIEIEVMPPPLAPGTPTPVPTQAPYPAPWMMVNKYSGGVCTVVVWTYSLKADTPYIVAVNVKDIGGDTVIYEKELMPARDKGDEFFVDLEPDGVSREITVYLYEIHGDTLVQIAFAGPLFLDEECTVP